MLKLSEAVPIHARSSPAISRFLFAFGEVYVRGSRSSLNRRRWYSVVPRHYCRHLCPEPTCGKSVVIGPFVVMWLYLWRRVLGVFRTTRHIAVRGAKRKVWWRNHLNWEATFPHVTRDAGELWQRSELTRGGWHQLTVIVDVQMFASMNWTIFWLTGRCFGFVWKPDNAVIENKCWVTIERSKCDNSFIEPHARHRTWARELRERYVVKRWVFKCYRCKVCWRPSTSLFAFRKGWQCNKSLINFGFILHYDWIL